ncbi:MAG: Crp/Fnr family transcriptional regulator [Proteobacteria bacterium]|nr:Crp/Fnr family transcriptional regulator [Pseudomonadota bacterium]
MPRSNALLAHVENDVWKAFAARGTRLELQRGQELQRPGDEVTYVYFPITAVIAVGAATSDGEIVNVALIGPEGVMGALEACGSRHAYICATVQVSGYAWRLPAGTYRELFSASEEIRAAVHRYCEVLLAESRQSVACNALHSVEHRLARTLLEFAEKSGSTQAPVTQDGLSQLLGVQRTTVAAALSALQRAGLVRGGRGVVEILDPAGLEQAACSCFETLTFIRADIQSRVAPVCEG